MKKIVLTGFCFLILGFTSVASYAGNVTDVSTSNDGKIITVKCSAGEDTKIFPSGSQPGKCEDNRNFGSYPCEFVVKLAKERCEKQ
jgi:hypothetical protein